MSKKHMKVSDTLARGETWLDPNKTTIRRRVVQDELLIRSEIYNPNNFDIVFYRITEKDQYVRSSLITLGPLEIVCKSKEFCILPTSYYFPRAFDRGRAGKWEHEIKDCVMELIRNYGDSIGKGNKLPSAPMIESTGMRRS